MKQWIIRGSVDEQGFSLIELMIAMVVLAIGILATMAMQFSALAGYSSAREMTGANELARTVEQMIHIEARSMDSGAFGSTHQAFANQPRFFDLIDGGTGWTLATEGNEPVTFRNSAGEQERFCVYVAGGDLSGIGAINPNNPDADFIRIAIAVVYPASGQTFPNGCNDNRITNNLDSTARTTLETNGFRAVHLTSGVRATGECLPVGATCARNAQCCSGICDVDDVCSDG